MIPNTENTLVSCGEPSGVGADIVLLAWKQMNEGAVPTEPFVYVGDLDHLQSRAKKLGITVPISPVEENKKFEEAISVYPINNPILGAIGKPKVEDQPAVLEAIETSVELIKQKKGKALVTLPIHKKILYEAGFKYQGHTQYLAHLSEGEHYPVMMLVGAELKTVPVTIHIPLHEVTNVLTTDLIMQTARVVANDLTTRFAIVKPRLAFAGLNPHAGEDGSLGAEEKEIIEPALSILRSEGINCLDVLSADTMFHAEAREKYDVAICMYHDQALIPLKTLSFHDGVNVTLGLPFIRTSPDHGTALDIAGTGTANPESFIAALRVAREMAEVESACVNDT